MDSSHVVVTITPSIFQTTTSSLLVPSQQPQALSSSAEIDIVLARTFPGPCILPVIRPNTIELLNRTNIIVLELSAVPRTKVTVHDGMAHYVTVDGHAEHLANCKENGILVVPVASAVPPPIAKVEPCPALVLTAACVEMPRVVVHVVPTHSYDGVFAMLCF